MADPISNGLFGVPWGIGGGQAILQAEVARYVAHTIMGGLQGVIGKDHLVPSELDTPSTGIKLQPGGMVINNRSAGAADQSYIDLAVQEILIDLDPTTGASRTDLVMIRVEDPYVSGNPWGAPADLQDGPFIVPYVEYGVSSAIKSVEELGNSWSAIPVCKVTRPSATGTILDSHITDLRTLVNPLTGGIQPTPEAVAERAEFTDIKTGPPVPTPAKILPTNTTFFDWPPEANWSVRIPKWATYLELDIVVYGAHVLNDSFWGDLRPVIAGVTQPLVPIDTNKADLVETSENLWVGGEYYLAPAIRGTTQTIKIQGRSNGEPGTLQSYWYTNTVARFKFKQTPGVA